jgi:hypothetical protein
MCPSLEMEEHDELGQITNMQLVNINIIIWIDLRQQVLPIMIVLRQ